MSDKSRKLIREIIKKHNRGKDITTLDLSSCSIISLPKEISTCIWLSELLISSNKDLKDLSPLSALVNLQVLVCSGTKISSLAPLSNLTHLQKLDCSETEISDLSPLSSLANLRIFIFSKTNVSDLSTLSNLTNLEQLYCHSVAVSDLSPLSNLTKLFKLFCSFTKISDLSPLISLFNLRILWFSSTRVSDLTPISDLTNLQSLDFRSTQVSDLSPLKKLTNLYSIDLSDSMVSDLSPLLSLIENGIPVTWSTRWVEGRGIYVQDCPLTLPPPPIVIQGNETIARYISEHLAEEPENIRFVDEAKLLVLGQPRAGKTSLRFKLKDTETDLPSKDETTRGIDIERLQFDFQGDNGRLRHFRYNVWDFGGQQIYHATHRFFLSQQTIYIAVVDTDVNDRQNELDYWLHMIELYGNGSPVVLLQNRKNDRDIEISSVLRKRFSTIWHHKDEYAINLKRLKKENNPKFAQQQLEDFIKFKTDIEGKLCQLPHVHTPMTAKKAAVRDALEALSLHKPVIDYKDYVALCNDKGLTDSLAQNDLLQLLHYLGVCLHYSDIDFLNRIVILKNRWATDAVFKILDNEIIKNNKGHFFRKDLNLVWSDEEYKGRVGELLELMKKFKICYQIGNTDEIIAPQLLDKNPPENYQYWSDSASDLRVICSYDFMPRGIMTQFIVSMHKDIVNEQRLAWESGFVAEISTLKAYAKAQESYDYRKIEIRTQGPGAAQLLQIMLRELDAIHETFNNPKVEKKIPCNCRYCSKLNAVKPKEFDYEELLEMVYENKRMVAYCSRGNTDIDIGRLFGVLGFTREQMMTDFQKYAQKLSKSAHSLGGFAGLDDKSFGDLNIIIETQTVLSQTINQGNMTNHPLLPPSKPENRLDIYAGLTAFVVIMSLLFYFVSDLEIKKFLIMVIAGLFFIPLLGAFHLVSDRSISEKNFMTLLRLIYSKIFSMSWLLKIRGKE